jgi:cytidine deaminase
MAITLTTPPSMGNPLERSSTSAWIHGTGLHSLVRVRCGMIKPDDPRQLAIALLSRSTCQVQVAAVITDRQGIFSWGWNSSGRDGFGEHAEAAAIRRANKKRLEGSTIYVAARRSRKKCITAKPCVDCAGWIRGVRIKNIIYRDGYGNWCLADWQPLGKVING